MSLVGTLFGPGPLGQTLARSPNMQLPWIGFRIFKWLLLALGVLTLLLVYFAWQTYPTAADIERTLGGDSTGEARMAATETLRTAWLTSVKDLGQMFVLTPLFPLIGAVVGYIFGVSRQESKVEATERLKVEAADKAEVAPRPK